MKRKITALCLVVALLAVAVVGGTMAYFTDTDEVENVFTVGNVKIEIEEEFNPDQVDDDGNLMLTQPGLKNEVKKFVYIKNTGKNAAYVRVTFSIPAELDPVLNLRLANAAVSQDNSGDKPWFYAADECDVNQETGMYDYVFYLKEALNAGVKTERLLSYVDLSGNFDWVADGAGWTDGTNIYYTVPEFKVIVSADAIQANGFDDYKAAFKAFDAQTQKLSNAVAEVSTADELKAALTAGGNVKLSEDLTITDDVTITNKTNINLNGKTMTVSKLEAQADTTITDGKIVNGETTESPAFSVSAGTLTLTNVEVVSEKPFNVVTNPTSGNRAIEVIGLEVKGGECVLNNSNITINNTEKVWGETIIGVGISGGKLTMNGGSITVTGVGGTRQTWNTAIFAMNTGDKTVTLNNVSITADKYLEAWGGNITINTTDANGSWADKVNTQNDATYTINYGN